MSVKVILETGLPEEKVIGLAPLAALAQPGARKALLAAAERQFKAAQVLAQEAFGKFEELKPQTEMERELLATLQVLAEVAPYAASDAGLLYDFFENNLVEYSPINKAGKPS